MSLDPCRPLSSLSLSLTSLLSRPVYIQRALSGHPTPTRICEWDEGSFMGGSLPSRRGGRLFSSFRYDSKDRACSQHEWGRQGAPFIYSSGGGTERAAFLAGGHCARAVPSWVSLTADSGASAGPVGAGLTSDRQRRTDTCRRGQHCPLIPVACRGRLPVL